MSIALDLGHSKMRSLRRQHFRLIGRSCRSEYSVMTDVEPRRLLLDQLHVPYLQIDGELIVPGDDADGVAALFGAPLTQLLPSDVTANWPRTSIEVTGELVKTLLPTAENGQDEICCFTTHGESSQIDERVATAIWDRGYRPLGIGSATAAVLAELGNAALTGVGVTIGSAHSEIALVRHGVEMARTTIPQAGDWLDEQLAAGQKQHLSGDRANELGDLRAARRWKESNSGSILSPSTPHELQLAAAYRELVVEVVAAVRDAYSAEPHVFDAMQPVSIVCVGGTASHPGIREMLQAELQQSPLPFAVDQVQVVRAWEYSVARGCLIRAALEEQTTNRRAA